MPLAVAVPGRRYPVGLPAVACNTGALVGQGYDVLGVAAVAAATTSFVGRLR